MVDSLLQKKLNQLPYNGPKLPRIFFGSTYIVGIEFLGTLIEASAPFSRIWTGEAPKDWLKSKGYYPL